MKTPDGIGCDLHPGTTTISWRRRDKYSRIELSWGFEDANGNTMPVGSAMTLDPKKAKPPFSTQTPSGANFWKAEYVDKNGTVVAVGGGVCS
jgi:hypothetical protein